MGFESGAGEFMESSAVGSYNAAQMRRSTFAWAARTSANVEGTISGGLLSSTDMQLSAAASGLVIYTSVGACIIPGNEATSQGGYHAFLSSQNSTTLATANATNPRIDLICATAADPQYTIPTGGTSGYVTINALTGTPTSGATLSNLSGAPALPGSSLLLGYVLVPAAATNLTSGDILNEAAIVQVGLQTNWDMPGRIIGYAGYNPSTSHTYTTASTSAAAIDATNLAATFTAPPTGQIDFEFTSYMSLTSAAVGAGNVNIWNVGSSAVYQAGLVRPIYSIISTSTAQAGSAVYRVRAAGLTAGTSYTFGPAWAVGSTSDTLSCYVGQSSSYGPAEIRIIAA